MWDTLSGRPHNGRSNAAKCFSYPWTIGTCVCLISSPSHAPLLRLAHGTHYLAHLVMQPPTGP
jgi:hypothetical protein